jgi:hypothetical protein
MYTKEQEKAIDAKRFETDQEEAHHRARGVTVGTAFGGSTEISMRGVGAQFLFAIMQPVEVVELINQLSASIGCHIHIMPRQDFASWRDWKVSEEELAHARGIQHWPGIGYPPFVKGDIPVPNFPHPEEQAGLKAKENLEKSDVAVEKNIDE